MNVPASRSARFDVVGVGANAADQVLVLPSHPGAKGVSDKIRITKRFLSSGGQTATALAACTALGLTAKYVGAIGDDEGGRRVCDRLRGHGVNIEDAVRRHASSQAAVILIDDRSGERIVLWDRDDRMNFADGELPLDAIRSARLVHVDDVDQGAAIAAARAAREAGIPVTSDLDRLTDRTLELVEQVTVPIFAEHVPSALTGVADPEGALRKIRKVNPGLLCVTLGDRGAMALDGDQIHHQPAFKVTAVDTTGAGDVFRGGFIYGLLQGWATDEILRFANAAAAVSCTRYGAIDSVPTLADVNELLALSRD